MRIFKHFDYTGNEQRWTVPEGVTEAEFECWGAAGGMPSSLAFRGKKRQVRGGSGPRNDSFTNNPDAEGQLGLSYANGAGYAAGIKSVTAGDVYYVYVGGNGGPGHSTIKLSWNGSTYYINLRGGAGGWNGGGDGGKGAHVFQNLYNSSSTRVNYRRTSAPNAAKAGQLWHDTNGHIVYKCNTTYTGGNSSGKWDKVTHSELHAVGPSGGGGGGATDIRFNGTDTTDRILVAGGGGGAGGTWNRTGTAAWTLRQVPASPAPPFGTDSKATGATGPDHTWATAVNYLVGGWGGGGLGGATGPSANPAPTTDGGSATPGGSGGSATGRHQDGKAPGPVHGSGGGGGGSVAGGSRGHGGSGGSGGSLGQGGNGANADGGYDDWCAGGGGGGGGYYGGGGGGEGFRDASSDSSLGTRGGGGGGGSNYASPTFTQAFLAGGARPPYAGKYGTGAGGNGGFARISYNKPPVVKWKTVPRAVLGGSSFDTVFTFLPAQVGGSGIAYYVVGTSATETDTFPTSETTIMVNDSTLTEFTHTYTAPAAGNTEAIFVKVVDLDGDASAWLKQTITGLAATQTSAATITSPAAGSQFSQSATVDWTVGQQTPLVAYRLGLTGTDLVSGAARQVLTGWRRGGSRVNLAKDPGFKTTSVWQSTSNATPTSDTTHPGVSGSDGKIAWTLTDDNSAEVHTVTWDNLNPGTTYRLHLDVASYNDYDSRPITLQVWDLDGLIAETTVDLSAVTNGTYVSTDLQFTPHTQGVYVSVVPSAAGLTGDPLLSLDFEDGTTGGFTAVSPAVIASSTAESVSGVDSLAVTGPMNSTNAAASRDITSTLTAAGLGAGDYIAKAWVWQDTAADTIAQFAVGGAGVTGARFGLSATKGSWQEMKVPFHWDGTNAAVLYLYTGNTTATTAYYDDIEVYAVDNANLADVGNTDSNQITYLANMLVEMVYEEDGVYGYGAYFDGSHANGLTGTVSWSGTANDSPSYLTGTDVLTDTLTYSGKTLLNGSLLLETLDEAAVLSGYDGSTASVAVSVNPSLPTLPTVALEVNNAEGLMNLTLNAADGAATNKTVSFDIFRNGTRIVTGLVPDGTSRQATYSDTPATGVSTSYTVRAFDSQGGYVDQTDGTVSVVN